MWLRSNDIHSTCFLILLSLLILPGSFAQCLQVNVGVVIDRKVDPCNGPVTLDAHFSKYNHTWNTGQKSQKILVSVPGTYIVIVDDGKGCTGTDTVEVTFFEKPILNLGKDTIAQCGGCVRLDAGVAAGLTYQWSTGDVGSSIQYCKAGIQSVSVKVTNEMGCSVSDTVIMNITEGIALNLGEDIYTCDSSVTLFAANEEYTYKWSNGESTDRIKVVQTGSYSLEVENKEGCKGIDTVEVILYPTPELELGNDPSPLCGGCISLTSNLYDLQYLWSTGATSSSITFCNKGSHVVSLEVMNAFGCNAKDSVHVSISPGLSIDLGEDLSVCDSVAILKVDGPYSSYTWSNGASSPSIKVNESGIYSVIVQDDKGCAGTDTIFVSFKSVPEIELGEDPPSRCGGCVVLGVNEENGVSYLWSTGESASQIRYCKEGNSQVWLNAVSSEGCVSSDSLNVNIKSGYNFSLGKDTATCASSVNLIGPQFSGASYIWNTGENTQTVSVNKSGKYILKMYNIPSCSISDTISDTIFVTINSALPSPIDILDMSDCQSKKYVAAYVLGATSYFWTVPAGSSIVSGQGTSTIVLSSSGAVNGAISVVAANDQPACQSLPMSMPIVLGEERLKIPNAFSPNNDGINDMWVIRNIQLYPENELIIINRWGNEVYRGKNYKNEWDGGGLNEGSYFYKLKVKICDEEKVYTGYVTLVR